MKIVCKALTIFIFTVPFLLMAELPNEGHSPSIVAEINKQIQQDSIDNLTIGEGEVNLAQTDKIVSANPAAKPDQNSAKYDFRKDGLFKALFHVGLNAAQIDGDAYSGYNTIGFDGGVGVLVRFHKYFSVSMELNYTMWGGKSTLLDHNGNLYRAKLDYVQVPISLNIHDKEIVMFSAGLNLAFLVYYNERNELGVNVTDTVQPQPKIFDLDAFAALHFIIKKQFGIGLKFSYSMISFRGVEDRYKNNGLTSIQGEYNNVITIRFMYILSAWKRK